MSSNKEKPAAPIVIVVKADPAQVTDYLANYGLTGQGASFVDGRARSERGCAVLTDEAARIAKVKRIGRAPAECGPEIVEVAPARCAGHIRADVGGAGWRDWL